MGYSKEWDKLQVKLNPKIIETITALNFKYMTPVQVSFLHPTAACNNTNNTLWSLGR